MIVELFNVIAPVLFIALVGYIWVKKGYEFPTDFVTRLTMHVGAPCLVFVGIMNLEDNFEQTLHFMSAVVVVVLCMLSLSTLLAYVLKLPKRAYIVALSSCNAGNMGIPLCLFAFGEKGMALGVAYFSVTVIFSVTISVFISHGNMTPATLSRTTMLYGVALASFFILSGTPAPVWLMNTTQLTAGVTIPLMLLTLGVSLARLKFKGSGKFIFLSALKLSMGFGVGFGIATLFGFEGLERNVFILQASMPVAVFSYMLASQYKRNPEEVAGMIFASTLLSMITIPLLLTYLL